METAFNISYWVLIGLLGGLGTFLLISLDEFIKQKSYKNTKQKTKQIQQNIMKCHIKQSTNYDSHYQARQN